jgi:hypothetical protein
MASNRKIIENDIATLVYYMQGGLDYDTAWQISNLQRRTLNKVIEKHYEKVSGKSRLI